MTCRSYFLDTRLPKFLLFKIALLIWNTIEIHKVVWKFHISLLFHWFECTDFKNSNLFEFVSKFCDEYFVEEYIRWPIEWHIDYIFWIPGCKIFHCEILPSYFEIPLKFDRIVWKFHILLLFGWFECTNFKNSNLFNHVSKFYDERFSEEYFWFSIKWHIDHIFWIRGCKKFYHSRLRS